MSAMKNSDTSFDQARLRGEAARTQLLTAATRPLWNIRGDGLSAVDAHLFGPPLSFLWDDDDDDVSDGSPAYEITEAGIALIPIFGTLVDSELSWWMRYLGYSSLPQIARTVQAAGADGNVKDILLLIKSPGGHVSGLAATCDAVWDVRNAGQKRIWAACSSICSAAYEIGSQCQKIYLTADGMGGCLGTLYLLSDWSGYYSQLGVEMFRITSTGGETYKGSGARGTKITPAQRADFKRLCDEYRTLFNGVVQRGRGFTDEQIATLTDGRVHIGENAKALGLVDGIATADTVLSIMGGNGDIEDPADPNPPDPDNDDDASDSAGSSAQSWFYNHLPNFQSQNDSQSQENTSMSDTQKNEKNDATPPSWFNKLMDKLNGEDSAPKTEPQNQSVHPVLVAALAAGLDSPEKLSNMANEHKALQDAQKATAAQQLNDARTSALNAATVTFGAGSQGLTDATEQINAQGSIEVLQALTSVYQAAKPKQLQPGNGRQSSAPVADKSESQKAADKLEADLAPENVYARRRSA